MEVDSQVVALAPGQTLHIPADVVHHGRNAGATTGRRIVMFSPAGMEGFFLEAGSPAPDQEVDSTAALASAVNHGWEFVR
jgi:ribosomal protein L16 Arg81 hydroxylase